MKARATVPVNEEGAALAARDHRYRDYLVAEAEKSINALAAEKGRKIAERPRLIETAESLAYPGIAFLIFEAETQPA